MKLLVYVMSKIDLLQPLLSELANQSVKGATILESTGMGRELVERDEFSIFGSLRAVLNVNGKSTKTLLFVTEDQDVQKIVTIIERVVGKLEGPDSGIVFTVPIDFSKGYKG